MKDLQKSNRKSNSFSENYKKLISRILIRPSKLIFEVFFLIGFDYPRAFEWPLLLLGRSRVGRHLQRMFQDVTDPRCTRKFA